MHLVYIILIALANNLDNIGVRIAYSISGIRISLLKNIWIAVITFAISTFAAFSGSIMSGLCGKRLSSPISMVFLVLIGLWIIFEPYIKKERNSGIRSVQRNRNSIYAVYREPENADMDNSKDIDFKEATLLGVALSMNNIGGGLSAGMIGLNGFVVGLLSALISFLALWIGNYISGFFNRWGMGSKASILTGIILIAIGIRQII